MGADFLKVDFEESGEGGGGYAKEMSAEVTPTYSTARTCLRAVRPIQLYSACHV